ncbi:hypothetical protein TEA_013096 [Camellia sinensis var. sinensis]|uniref:2Fe-2S ferredoxin-type domain-containing protein n=1 Tax=Camellia sinensis var. sinensis TaxID=542762 RepID=A0A4S4D4R1_CAMSN|nr:hypothetical protein TEA_013096 [Camellia sinensis var. sinensis]
MMSTGFISGILSGSTGQCIWRYVFCKTSIPDLLHTFEKPDPCHTARIFKACIVVEFEMRWIYLSGINGGMEPPEEPPAVNFAFVSSVLLPNGTPDVHFRVACGGQKLRDIMLDSNIELYGPYSRPLLNCGGGGTCGTCIVEVEFLICLVLTILGYIPGIIYALYAILCVDRDTYNADQYRSLA